jgi:transcriptional regulator with XRE-family HTH domain
VERIVRPPQFSPNRLRDTRRAAKISREDLGRAIGRTTQQVQRYETGRYLPTVDTLCLLVHALGCPFEALFDDVTAVTGGQR